MADKVYIGKEAEAYHSSPEKEYSRVTIVVGNDEDGSVIAYTAGNDTKDELLVECPWGTQAMADALLAALAGFKYKPYTAEGTYTHPAAELGDAVTVGDDIYGGIYVRNTEYSVEPISDLSAPTTEEIDDEYDYEEPIKRELKRRIINGDTAVKASITVELGEIRLEIAGKIDSNDAQSLIQQTLNNITLSVTDGTQANTSKFVISGTGISAVSDNITLNANSINLSTATISGQLSAAKIDVAGLITAGGLSIKQDTLSSVEVQYALSASNTTAPATGWNTTAPAWEDGKYMWQKTVWTYANGSTSESSPTCLTGATGATGTSISILGSYNTYAELIAAHPTGNTGDGYLVGGDLYVWNGSAWQDVGQIKGDTGATGKGITSLIPQYYLSTSSVAATGGTWQNSVPAYVSGRYYWERSHITWSDGTESNTTETYNSALTASVRDAGTAVSGVNAIESNIYTPGTTTINGAKITTGTVTANQIDATNLHVSAANIDGTLVIGQLPNTVAETSDIPTKVSDLSNDTGFITSSSVPTKTSQLTNDSGYQNGTQVDNAITGKGYQTSAQVESAITAKGYQNAIGVTSIINGTVTTDFVEALNIDVEAAQIKDTLTIGQLPSTVAEMSDIPTKVSELTNDSGYQTAANVSTAISGKADKTAAVDEEVLIYKSAVAGTSSMAKPSGWITSASGAQNEWTTKRPQYQSGYPVLFVCKERKTVSGAVSFTTPVIDETTTIIDGGRIVAGSVTANAIHSGAVTTDKLDADAVTANKLSTDAIKSRNFNDDWTIVYDGSDGFEHDDYAFCWTCFGHIWGYYNEDHLVLGGYEDGQGPNKGVVMPSNGAAKFRLYNIHTHEIYDTEYSLDYLPYNIGDELPLSTHFGYPFSGTFLNLASGALSSNSFKISDDETEFIGTLKNCKMDDCRGMNETYRYVASGSVGVMSFSLDTYLEAGYGGATHTFTYNGVDWRDENSNYVDLETIGFETESEESGDYITVNFDKVYTKIITYQDLIDLGLIH